MMSLICAPCARPSRALQSTQSACPDTKSAARGQRHRIHRNTPHPGSLAGHASGRRHVHSPLFHGGVVPNRRGSMNYVTAEIPARDKGETARHFRSRICQSHWQEALPFRSQATIKRRLRDDETIVFSLPHADGDHDGCCRSKPVDLRQLLETQRDSLMRLGPVATNA